MIVEHIIPADRLNKRYFRRWFYWRGISRALLYAARRTRPGSAEESTVDLPKVPHVLGVPRYMFQARRRRR